MLTVPKLKYDLERMVAMFTKETDPNEVVTEETVPRKSAAANVVIVYMSLKSEKRPRISRHEYALVTPIGSRLLDMISLD